MTDFNNHHTQMLREIERVQSSGATPRLLLHSCCAPCSTRALTLLANAFELTVFYYNPNIFPADEYVRRLGEQRRLLSELPLSRPVNVVAPEYDHDEFLEVARGFEDEPEGGERCRRCFELRLKCTANAARELGCAYFATTLTVSPRKNARVINAVGGEVAVGAEYLVSDMKKQDGYLESIRLSEKYGLYRQRYCGCEFSSVE